MLRKLLGRAVCEVLQIVVATLPDRAFSDGRAHGQQVPRGSTVGKAVSGHVSERLDVQDLPTNESAVFSSSLMRK